MLFQKQPEVVEAIEGDLRTESWDPVAGKTADWALVYTSQVAGWKWVLILCICSLAQVHGLFRGGPSSKLNRSLDSKFPPNSAQAGALTRGVHCAPGRNRAPDVFHRPRDTLCASAVLERDRRRFSDVFSTSSSMHLQSFRVMLLRLGLYSTALPVPDPGSGLAVPVRGRLENCAWLLCPHP